MPTAESVVFSFSVTQDEYERSMEWASRHKLDCAYLRDIQYAMKPGTTCGLSYKFTPNDSGAHIAVICGCGKGSAIGKML